MRRCEFERLLRGPFSPRAGQCRSSISITSRLRGPLVAVVAVLLLFAGFLLGRRSAPPDAGGTEVHAEDKEGDRQEEGVIRFTPLALSRAGVRVTRVRLSAV